MKKKSFLIVLVFLIALFLIKPNPLYNIAKQKGYKALKVIVYYNNIKPDKDSDFIETSHFIINGKSTEKTTVEELGNLLEKSYYLIGDEFNYYPEKKTPVIVYGSMEEFWNQNKSLDGQSVMGLYHLGVIHLVVPEVFDMDLDEYEKNGPVLHEYTHKTVDDISCGNVEIWFTEGLALYQEYLNYGVVWADGITYEKQYTMEELRKDFLSLDSVQAYKQSLIIIKDIYQNEGKDKIIELIEELGKGIVLDDALNKVGLEIETLEGK
ncbi:MAG: hypothetical protein GX154_06105 [Clostridiales bacterium]|nr:hypothetical protein [Clostridiales bacterium]